MRHDPTQAIRWTHMVVEHRAALGEILRLAERFPNDGALDGCRSWAQRTLRQLNVDAPYSSSIGEWGRNGKGPAIASQLHSARTFAELAERRVRRAA